MSKRLFPDQEAANFIGKHSVALLVPDQTRPGGVRLVGSGSLVIFDAGYFILTASHVWAALRKSSTIYYSAIASISHGIGLHKDSLLPYSLDENITEEPGPFDADLTLLELHAVDYRKMDTRLSFFPLEREDSGKMDDCVIIGAPGVLAHPDAAASNTLFFELRGIFVEILTHEAEHDGLDFLTSLPFQDAHSPIWTGTEVRCLGRNAINKLSNKVRHATKA